MNDNAIKNLPNSVLTLDPATKEYVDLNISGSEKCISRDLTAIFADTKTEVKAHIKTNDLLKDELAQTNSRITDTKT
jgi:hypothetical protein